MQTQFIFSVPLTFFDHETPAPFNEALRQRFLAMEQEGDRHRDTVKRDTQHGGLFESNFDLFKRPEPEIQELFRFCHRALASAIHQMSDYNEQEFARLNWHYDAWFHITPVGGFQGLHNHPNATWSGIYCIDTGNDVDTDGSSGLVRFHDPRTNANYYGDPGNTRLKPMIRYGGVDYTHQPGRLVIFPSYLMHEIFPHQGSRPRVIVAFNSWLTVSQ